MKKAISPVVAMALLLVTAVVGVVGFQSWYNDFSSQVLTDTETQSSNSVSQTGIDNVIGNTLYFRNSGSDSITINQVTVAGFDCYQSGAYSNGVSEIDLYDCMNNLSTTTPEVVVYTDNKIYSKKILVPENFVATFSYPSQYFVSIWDTTLNSSSGSSDKNTIVLPLFGGPYNFTVDWGDGTIENVVATAFANHTYSTPGRYTILINGTIVGFRFANSGDRLKLLQIRQWGPLNIGSTGYQFMGTSNLEILAQDEFNLTDVSFVGMFNSASSITTVPGMSDWNVSSVGSMFQMFQFATSFDQDLSSWDISNLSSINNMFRGASSFNSDISSWNTSGLTNMDQLFFGATSFNQDLSSWDVDQVTSCSFFNLSASSWVLPQPNFTGC